MLAYVIICRYVGIIQYMSVCRYVGIRQHMSACWYKVTCVGMSVHEIYDKMSVIRCVGMEVHDYIVPGQLQRITVHTCSEIIRLFYMFQSVTTSVNAL